MRPFRSGSGSRAIQRRRRPPASKWFDPPGAVRGQLNHISAGLANQIIEQVGLGLEEKATEGRGVVASRVGGERIRPLINRR